MFTKKLAHIYLILFDESNEGSPLNLNRLASPIIQGNNKMEEIGFPKITRWLLLKMRPADTGPETDIHTQQINVS